LKNNHEDQVIEIQEGFPALEQIVDFANGLIDAAKAIVEIKQIPDKTDKIQVEIAIIGIVRVCTMFSHNNKEFMEKIVETTRLGLQHENG